jgi:hypothetical protein
VFLNGGVAVLEQVFHRLENLAHIVVVDCRGSRARRSLSVQLGSSCA